MLHVILGVVSVPTNRFTNARSSHLSAAESTAIKTVSGPFSLNEMFDLAFGQMRNGFVFHLRRKRVVPLEPGSHVKVLARSRSIHRSRPQRLRALPGKTSHQPCNPATRVPQLYMLRPRRSNKGQFRIYASTATASIFPSFSFKRQTAPSKS